MGFSPRQVDEMTLWEFIACASDKTGKSGDMDEDRARSLGIAGF